MPWTIEQAVTRCSGSRQARASSMRYGCTRAPSRPDRDGCPPVSGEVSGLELVFRMGNLRVAVTL